MKPGLRSIYNFEHNLQREGMFYFGPYEFNVPQELIGGSFAQAKKLVFAKKFSSSGLQRTFAEKAAVSGDWNVTALLTEHPALDEPSVLMPDNPWVNGGFDLSLILSLLTGACVALDKDSPPDFKLSPALPIVCDDFFAKGSKVDWTLLPAMQAAGGGDALYALSLARDSQEGVVKLAMGSAALDGLVSRWHSTSGENRYSPEVKDKIKFALQSFETNLTNAKVDELLIKDIMSRTNNLSSNSALSKLTAFLSMFEMYPKDAGKDVALRLKFFNVLRNSVAHTGVLRLSIAGQPDVTGRVAGAVAVLLQYICRVYIAKYLLGIVDAKIEETQQVVKKFFTTGKLFGNDIITEDYDAYRQRLIDHFEEHGNLDL
ncbi:hypothetical protein AOA59_05495 [Pseudomonas sp. 2822-15]|uniref:hypothetical protein n=1 Tax=Pseudomonas sp. 2822-15 TaxID=1712677 RepID=UPI000C153477|nr:hypothetical protein [Pseudomonas sp. 2822-15]PIB45224.1 hypothetical protein AOA59_05495 [Pseudomonas sp. 2822-15]